MSKVRIELNSKGIQEFLKSSEMNSYLDDFAMNISNSCGNGYAHDTYSAASRVIASVYTDSPEAERDNSKNNTLLKAVST